MAGPVPGTNQLGRILVGQVVAPLDRIEGMLSQLSSFPASVFPRAALIPPGRPQMDLKGWTRE